jgi:hypothetical protein
MSTKIEKSGTGAIAFDKKPFFLLETSDINNYLSKRDKNFVGTFSKKDIPKIMKTMEKRPYASSVINLDDHSGTHWVVLIRDKGTWFWIDPLGATPPKIAHEYLKPLKFNESILQDANGAECGLYCIKIILDWLKNPQS